jgi:hypothetical protein
MMEMRIRLNAGLVITIVSLYLGGCVDRPSLTTNTHSSQLDSDRQKIEFLGKYFKLLSPIEATEFHIVYHDNDFAPSDSDIEAAIKVSPSNLKLWTEGMQLQQQSIDLAWGYALIAKDKQRWNIRSKPKIYRRSSGDGFVVVFEPEGIIFKSYHAH